MKYTFSNVNGEQSEQIDMDFVKSILELPESYWLEGGGDCSINVNEEERLIFFKLKEGVFIMQHPDYLSPKIESKAPTYLSHYIGGEEMQVPDICLCDKETAFEIIKSYITNQKLTEDYEWVDIFGLDIIA
jgi:hypothetical protein